MSQENTKLGRLYQEAHHDIEDLRTELTLASARAEAIATAFHLNHPDKAAHLRERLLVQIDRVVEKLSELKAKI